MRMSPSWRRLRGRGVAAARRSARGGRSRTARDRPSQNLRERRSRLPPRRSRRVAAPDRREVASVPRRLDTDRRQRSCSRCSGRDRRSGSSSPSPRGASLRDGGSARGRRRSVFRDDFARLQKSHPGVKDVLLRLLAEQVRRISDRIVEAHHVDADTRVRRRLCELAASYGSGDEEPVVPLTQEDLAAIAGTSRATVNRVLRDGREARNRRTHARACAEFSTPERPAAVPTR